ncbi:MAG TPA: GNAT family N-acetyltransferase [Gemmatimonadales bacterium]|nr:GNAT family N-acetyltransferase [Gemmatimonadales bacterium]
MSAGVTVTTTLRPLQEGDREALERITRATNVFKEYEIPVALEVFDAAIRPGQTDYEATAAEVEGRFAGWAAWGQRPCTEGTWDLYWIAVDPALHGAGVGTTILEEVERRLRGRARLLVVETGGRPAYDATRGFYLARGYTVAATIPDLYAPGDAQVILTKRFTPSQV